MGYFFPTKSFQEKLFRFVLKSKIVMPVNFQVDCLAQVENRKNYTNLKTFQLVLGQLKSLYPNLSDGGLG